MKGKLDLKRFLNCCALAAVLALGAAATAQTLTGTVKNSTTGKPGAGDEVVLLSLGQGMEEAGRTTADAKGNFSFDLKDAGGPHLVRVIHQGVTYHRMAPPGTTSVEVEVYDAAKKVPSVAVVADVMRVQAENGRLEVVRLFAVNNSSQPPRTQMNDQNFEFYLPEGAQVDQGMAKTAGGEPINSAPVPQKEKNRYAFIFPLRPGETQFQVVYHLPYSGEASIDPKALYAAQHFVVMLPKSMQFSPAPGAAFQEMKDPQQSDAVVQVASNTTVGEVLSFKVSGAGMLQASSESGGTAQAGGEQSATSQGGDSRPGGGLGPPIDAPDPLQKYRWWILGGFALALAAGGVYVASRQQAAARAPAAAAGGLPAAAPADFAASAGAGKYARPASSNHSSMLLEALKEEIFQLEVERKQGRISQAEYEKNKAALDQTLERALKRTPQKA